MIEGYIVKANGAIRSGDAGEVDAIARQIVSAFHSEIPHLSSYRGQHISGGGWVDRHTTFDLKKLIGKLRVLRERKDDALYGPYGPYGLGVITASIRQLEDALAKGAEGVERENLYNRIDHIYANHFPTYAQGLSGFMYSDDEPCDEQTRLRIEKLSLYRDEELRKLRIAESRSANVSVANTNTNTNTNDQVQSAVVQIDITTTFERIDQLPDDSLSDEGKTALKGMLGDLSTKDEKKREGKLQKLLHWLGDKGIDVAIAVLPYVIKAINPDLAG